jgi:hypothetical protein
MRDRHLLRRGAAAAILALAFAGARPATPGAQAPASAPIPAPTPTPISAPTAERIAIVYAEPDDPAHRPLLDLLKENRVLERVREMLAPFRWPRPLRLELKGCDGEANAFYEEAVITVCYEYVSDIWHNARSPKRPVLIAREDAFVGPLADTFLHEAGHAVFDLFQVPVLGREEDAADQFAAYRVLQLPADRKRRLILGAAFGYAGELKVGSPRELARPRLRIARYTAFADEHGTPAQRLYNLLCVAYGSDKALFAEVVTLGYLPQERADICEDEYRQIDRAYRRLIAPLLDEEAKP